MARFGSDGDSDDAMQYSKLLRQQKKLCDEAMELVNAGVALQNASPPDTAGADAKLSRAVTLMEQALAMEYPTQEERDASQRLNNKMNRYVKMIRSQREKGNSGTSGRGHNTKYNILPMDSLPSTYNAVVELLTNSSAVGDVFESLKSAFGFQEGNVTNQKEHVLLMLTNFKLQEEDPNQKNEEHHQLDRQQELDMANKGTKRFHARIFANYIKWCKYVSTKPAFTSDPVVDIVLFFLVWGEAGNFRQMPECLCFLLHTLLPQASSRGGSKNPGDFLAEVIRPMYNEIKKDNDKKTSQGARAPHAEIRNYDDFNEFFWSKKCLKYSPTTICEAFGEVDKKGRPKVIKKSFVEKRTWIRALISFRRIFCFNCALFLAVCGFALNVVMYCPDTPILYGAGLSNGNSRGFTVFGKNFTASDVTAYGSGDGSTDKSGSGASCNHQMLATCLGMTYTKGIFESIPIDFKALLQVVPFTDCLEQTTGRCGCYLELVDNCFSETGQTLKVTEDELTFSSSSEYDQSMCVVNWRAAVESIIKEPGPGKLNCEICQLGIKALITNGRIGDLIGGLLKFGDGTPLAADDINNTDRTDMGGLAMVGGGACLVLVCVCEFFNKISSRVGSGYVGRSLPVPFRAYCRYTCFWIFLFMCKLTFDYQYMIKALVETTLFIWYANEDEYLPYSNFILQVTFHNIIYILFLWIPSFFVFMYDAQIFYSVLSVIFGSFAGFNLRIGELRSFRVLRLSFKSIPRMFNKKIVPNIQDGAADGKKKKKKKKKGEKEESTMPVRHFERVSMADGIKPLTVKAQMYSNLLDQGGDHLYNEVKTPNDKDDASSIGRQSQLGSVTGVSGADFERTIPFAMAWNRCLGSLREADIISDRELNVLSYLIDSKDAEDRKLYPPAFLTAGKLDESLDIIEDCSAVYEKLSSDKKKKEKTLQKIENTMRERLTKDDLRVESLLGSYKFTSQAVRFLLGDEHRDLNECFEFMEEMAAQQSVLKGLNLKSLHECRAACAELMKALLEVPKTTSDNSIKFQRALYRVIDCVETVLNCMKKILAKQENLVQILTDTPLKQSSFFFPGDAQQYANVQLQRLVNSEAALDIVSRAYQLLTVDNFDAEPRSEEGRRRLRFFANSLFMDMPDAKPIRKIRSLTVSTPYYNEIVMYSIKDLTAQNDDSIKLIYYLKTIYPFEWENLLERLQAKDMEEALKKFPEEVQLWASYRGQTLARTVRGMMYNEDAIRFLHWLEICENEVMHQFGCPCNKCKRLDDMVALKFNYLCTCQIYGKQKDEQRQQASDLEYLLRKHPTLRVAYVDGPKKLALFEAKLSSGAGECVISRDAMRMASRLDFFRLHSWFYGNLGWYFTQTMTVVGVFFFIYGKVYMALSGMDTFFLEKGGLGIGGTLNTSWAFQFGFLLVVPVVAVVGVEQGFRHGVTYLLWNILTLGPLFFTFQMGTRMHYFDRTLVHGGAKYRATGRGFTIKHEKFAELYRFYAFSHFYRAVELVFLLILFRVYGTFSWCNCSWTQDALFYNYFKPSDNDWNTRCYAYYYQTNVVMGAVFFNPSGFDWDKLIEDYTDWQNWLKTTNDSAASWSGWWLNEQEYLEHSTRGARIVSMIRKTRFFFIAYGMYLQLVYKSYYEDRDLVIEKGSMISRVKKKLTFKQKKLRKMKFVLSCCGLLVAAASLLIISVSNLIEIAIIILLAAYWFLQICIYRNQTNHVVVRGMARSYDRWVGWIILGPVLFIAMFLPFLSAFQQRVMFNNAFTSGLEVSKLFANEAASSTSKIVKVKRVAKKKKRND
ncbi:unnamed protein product [Peronospora belbahrii]|uniref:1,3-beta-glucan synthase n=1 Tax=Peronospora belbahrii TaxID=622444 RepID=A0AAU9KW11_9STRA|nr:unnamed protein product [Peronospora belbahrii]